MTPFLKGHIKSRYLFHVEPHPFGEEESFVPGAHPDDAGSQRRVSRQRLVGDPGLHSGARAAG